MNLSFTAREIFTEALRQVDAGLALQRAVRLDGSRLQLFDSVYNLDNFSKIFSIGIGKAALPLAASLTKVLKGKLAGGVVSAPQADTTLPAPWSVFAGGHPLPNESSFAAAHAAIDLLHRADDESALVIFLVSGGGSAMLELPHDERVTLDDLREANRVLVGCGATIAEINAIRRCLSVVKGGGLSRLAPRAAQITLIVSDTNRGDEANVASGPTLASQDESGATSEVPAIVAHYGLGQLLPLSVMRALGERTRNHSVMTEPEGDGARRGVHVLIDNQNAIDAAAHAARRRGFLVETTANLVETPISDGCRELVSRLLHLQRRVAAERTVCLISGGEFQCPVRGLGFGGRNSEAALRCAFEINAQTQQLDRGESLNVVALHVGTDGIDGNSAAAGAVADETTLIRARRLGKEAHEYLARSDSYSFFQSLGDTIVTGPTGTNVRDLRILLASLKDLSRVVN
jgi:hydroxypyruvate reductase